MAQYKRRLWTALTMHLLAIGGCSLEPSMRRRDVGGREIMQTGQTQGARGAS